MSITFPVAQAPALHPEPILVNLGDYDPIYHDWYVAVRPDIPLSVSLLFTEIAKPETDTDKKFAIVREILKTCVLEWNFTATQYTTSETTPMPQPSENDGSVFDMLSIPLLTLLIQAVTGAIAPPKNSVTP